MIRITIALALLITMGCSARIYTEDAALSPDDTLKIETAIHQFGVTYKVGVVEAERVTKGRTISYRVVIRNIDDPDLAEGRIYELVYSNQTWVVCGEVGHVVF